MTDTGVHQTHCCVRHGCKYGGSHYECPVTAGTIQQLYACEWCPTQAECEATIRETQADLDFLRERGFE